MTIPDYQTAMLPLLEAMADGKPHRLVDFTEALADRFHLTPEERAARPASGGALVFSNRLQWAKTYMAQAGPFEPMSRGVFRITDAGREALVGRPERIGQDWLRDKNLEGPCQERIEIISDHVMNLPRDSNHRVPSRDE